MGRGQALQQADGENMQAPRFTTMLRVLGQGNGQSPQMDMDALYMQRQRLLAAKQANGDTRQQISPAGQSQLAQSLIGPWRQAPAAAREAYQHYIKAAAALLGGEAASEEVQEAAAALWPHLSDAPALDLMQSWAIAGALKGVKETVISKVGPVEDVLLKEAVTSAHALKGWRAKLGSVQPTTAGQTSRAPPGFSGTPAAPQADNQGSSIEFGADLDFHVSRLQQLSPEEAVLAMCNMDTAAAFGLNDRASSAHAPATQSLREMFAQAGAGSQPAYTPDNDEDDEEYAPKGPVAAKKVSAKWLREWCAAVGAGAAADDDALPLAVCRILFNSKSSEEVAAQLFELFGDTSVESIGELVQHRKALTANLRVEIAALRDQDKSDTPDMPTYGTAVSITTDSRKLLEKLERKEARRGPKARADADLEWLAAHGFDELVAAEVLRETGGAATLAFADGLELKIGDGSASAWTRGALPQGTTRKAYKKYEEVRVPAVKTAVPPPSERLVQIEELEEWAQLPFDGYKQLNRIQSRIFPTAFNSNENLLVCAPTGAGKTNIAMIAVLREVGQHMQQGIIQKASFKIVYVAPMKALAAEVTSAFAHRLAPLGLKVRELTGDMQLSKKEMEETQMIVTTPEKWDVITRKGSDVSVAALVRLLIIDEVHLLNDERGPVIETLIARTQRQVESSQSMIRIVGLSATLPNYKDVATFLGVNHDHGLFYFDASYRPVPLEMQFVGVSEKNIMQQKNLMDQVCYEKVVDSLRKGHQAMVFVHSRKDTGKTARTLALKAQQNADEAAFDCQEHPKYGLFAKEAKKSRNKELAELFDSGVGIHHAGMLRGDRNLMERLFREGALKVLCTTATLAWGVNLPAHTVIIKGTQVYDAKKGSFAELGMLDVQQIFGRAGRPQFEDSGEGIIITTHDKLAHYLSMLTHQLPIESQFVSQLVDNLNAEIVLGTVTNLKEAIAWLSYTYLYVRMQRNPLPYAVTWQELAADPRLDARRKTLIVDAARELERSKMARFDEKSGNLYVTELGRVASHFYIRHSSVVTFSELLKPHMSEAEVLSMMARSSEFENVAVREEELPELDELVRNACPFDVKGGPENKHGKVCTLLQAYVSRARVDSFSLIADMMYVSSNAPRIARALFEICLRRGWGELADLCLGLSKSMELRLWGSQHPLRQMEGLLGQDLLHRLEDRGLWLDQLQDMEAREIGSFLRQPQAGAAIRDCADSFPALHLQAQLHPITRTVLRVQLSLTAAFKWKERVHGGALRWHIWVEDSDNDHIYHSEVWTLTKKMMSEPAQVVAFTIPIFEPLPSQYYTRVVSDSWLGAEAFLAMSFKGLILPERHPPHTQLLDLDPLPVSALANPAYQAMYRFTHFNPLQTQAFHTLYHTEENVLLGAPTGSGKTISAELTMLHLFNHHPDRKIIYIAPLKALVKERMAEWGRGLCRQLGKRMVELTGDVTPDLRALLAADIIICTPEKWDGISRSWAHRGYVTRVGLLIIDEIHLLGADRGPILEVIVSRMRYIAAHTDRHIRFVGLSTALANAQDLADWLGIRPQGLFNFKPSVRPVPLECHIQGYAGKFYCPRMATMNKPAYAAIQTHSPRKPVLVFVSSRRQTRLTALDLIGFAAADERPRQWVHMSEDELEQILASVQDSNLRHCLQFGIGMHHAGLKEADRTLVEMLFVGGQVQVLVATSTLAWGVNTPAHLVIIKGTEYFDAPTRRYVDFPITDVLQMMGRAGRPQYDQHGVAVIMVAEPKKSFYKKFLYEPFPVESSLPGQVAEHFNAEIVGGTISSKQDAVDYLTWTFFFRRLLQNPSYYDLPGTSPAEVNQYLSDLVQTTLEDLQDAGCIGIEEDDSVVSLTMGRIASFYYLKHATMAFFTNNLQPTMDLQAVLWSACGVTEFDELPVRHNEDKVNATLSTHVRWPIPVRLADDPHAKANLLLQAHMGRVALPMSDYMTDTKSVLDNSLRILQAIIDIAADSGWLQAVLATMHLVQGIIQGCWPDESSLLMLPHIDGAAVAGLEAHGFAATADLVQALQSQPQALRQQLVKLLGPAQATDVVKACERLPAVRARWSLLPPGAGKEDDGSGKVRTLEVELIRAKSSARGSGAPRVLAPRFPKVKEEGWWLVVGDEQTQELHAIKRMSFGTRSTTRLTIPTHSSTGEVLRGVTLHLLPDSYLGLDQQHQVALQ